MDLQKKYIADDAAITNSKTLTPDQKGQKHQSLLKQYRADQLAVLTPAQRAMVMKRQQQMAQAGALDQQLKQSMTPAQQSQIEGIIKTLNGKANDIASSKSMTDDQKRAALQQLSDQKAQQISSILTPAQRDLYDKLMKIIQPPMIPNPRMVEIQALGKKIHSSLTKAQQAQIAAIQNSDRSTASSIDADKTLSPEAKHQKIAALIDSEQQRITALLTPEQRADLAKMQKLMPNPQIEMPH